MCDISIPFRVTRNGELNESWLRMDMNCSPWRSSRGDRCMPSEVMLISDELIDQSVSNMVKVEG